jgi:hypothetical protein
MYLSKKDTFKQFIQTLLSKMGTGTGVLSCNSLIFYNEFSVFFSPLFPSVLADFPPPGSGSKSAFRMRIQIQEANRMRIRNTESNNLKN